MSETRLNTDGIAEKKDSTPIIKMEIRPSQTLVNTVNKLVDDLDKSLLKTAPNGNTMLNQMVVIFEDLRDNAKDEEEERGFAINEEKLQQKKKLDDDIDKAENDYSEKFAAHEKRVSQLRQDQTLIHDRILEVQGQTMIDSIQKMVEFQLYHDQIQEEINSLNIEISNQGCCGKFKMFCCTPQNISNMRTHLDDLKRERLLLDSKDPKSVGKLLTDRLEKRRLEVTKELETLANNQPVDNSENLREKRDLLQASIEADRASYYQTISPPMMLQLLRVHSFARRLYVKLQDGKDKAMKENNDVLKGIYTAALSIVTAFQEAFYKLCKPYICHAPENELIVVTFDQYYKRFHELEEKDKKTIINGSAQTDALGKIFVEHVVIEAPKLKI